MALQFSTQVQNAFAQKLLDELNGVQAPAWAAGVAHAVNDYVFVPGTLGGVFRYTTAGTTGTVAPSGTSVSITDGSAVCRSQPGTMRLYNTAQPATGTGGAETGTQIGILSVPASALAAATSIVSLTTPLSAAASSGLAVGTPCSFRYTDGAGNAIMQGSIGQVANAGTWTAAHTYAPQDCVSSNGNVYQTTPGGVSGTIAPTGTTTSSDGVLTWTFASSATVDGALSNMNIISGQTISLNTMTLTVPGQ